MNPSEPPDPTEAVAEAVADVIYGSLFIDTSEWSSVERSEIFHGIASSAIAADRQALEEQGYTIVPAAQLLTDEAFKTWLSHRAGANYDESNAFERGLQAAYQDAFVRLIDGDAAEANAENGEA